jgi:hypothetical protein
MVTWVKREYMALPMLWILASLFFFWCAFREILKSFVAPAGYDFPTPVSKPYLATVLGFALLLALPATPVRNQEKSQSNSPGATP